uniref:Uncharacterized protein n=1 Tax=Oryza punctata TaxID=4537 RepID=A0A0E0KPM4_ORYPU
MASSLPLKASSVSSCGELMSNMSVKTTTATNADEPQSPLLSCVPQSTLDDISVPSNFVPFHAAVEWESGPRPRCPEACSEHRHRDIIVIPVDRVKLRPSHRTIFIMMTSSSKAPKKPSQWRSELGDRHHLLRLRPPGARGRSEHGRAKQRPREAAREQRR